LVLMLVLMMTEVRCHLCGSTSSRRNCGGKCRSEILIGGDDGSGSSNDIDEGTNDDRTGMTPMMAILIESAGSGVVTVMGDANDGR
jgi:hypothetical protein